MKKEKLPAEMKLVEGIKYILDKYAHNSQAEFARKAGISKITLYKLMQGITKNPDPRILVKIAKVAEMSPVVIFKMWLNSNKIKHPDIEKQNNLVKEFIEKLSDEDIQKLLNKK